MGRPPKYKTPEDMQSVIDSYYLRCDTGRDTICTDKAGRPLTDNEGQPIYYKKRIPYTMEGLDLALDFLSGDARKYYKDKKKEFNDTITRAEKIVKRELVERSMMGEIQPQVSVLMMKTNAGYSDKPDLNQVGDFIFNLIDQFKGGKQLKE